ncbi:MAG TPA: flagellar biosynthetic protein FliO [Lacisediminihabitans sp.]|uniref:flagellar biosynthetic protein FliO n=1 Tax=Lacisediminihabitans sp. TaxID=2787631 RepID=UPI002ED960C4
MDTIFVVLRVILSLAVIVGLLWIVQRRVTRGTKAGRSAKLVNVVTRQGIAQKASVVVVDVEGVRYVLGVTEHSVTALNIVGLAPDPPEEHDAGAGVREDSAAAFGAILEDTRTGPAHLSVSRAELRTRRAPTGPLDGSIVSPATWRRAAAALRQGR